MSRRSDRFVSEALKGGLGEEMWKRMIGVRKMIRPETNDIIGEVIEFGVRTRKKILNLETTSMDECRNILEIIQKALVFSQMTDDEVNGLLQEGGWKD